MDVTTLIVILTGVISFYAFNNSDIMSKWIFNPYLVNKKKEYYRFLTSGFIHADWMHLIFNMISLYYVGSYVESMFQMWFGPVGIFYYIALYLLAIVASDIPTFLKHKGDYDYNGLGASGGVSAVLFTAILIEPWAKIYVYFIPIKFVLYGALFLIYSYYAGKRGGDRINHDAHFYGAIFGIVFTIALRPETLLEFGFKLLQWDGRFF